jgi:hypothetical protein
MVTTLSGQRWLHRDPATPFSAAWVLTQDMASPSDTNRIGFFAGVRASCRERGPPLTNKTTINPSPEMAR